MHIRPTGAKIWRFRYDHPISKKRTKISFGDYPTITLAQARAKREEMRALLLNDIDPALHRQQQQAQLVADNNNTFHAVCEQWREKKRNDITAKTLDKYWRQLELYVLPFIGHYPISDITPPLIVATLRPVESKGTLDTVHRLITNINAILNFAVNGGLIPFNPCLKVAQMFKRHKKQNNPSIRPEQLPQFMQDLAKSRATPQTKAAIKFKLLTIVRSSEAVNAEWEEIDLKNAVWTIPAHKMKMRVDHCVPLSKQALQILAMMKPITGNSRYVFPKSGSPRLPMVPDTINNALKRMGYKGVMTAHGMRSLASVHLNEQGENPDAVEKCLAHDVKGNSVRRAYLQSNFFEQRIAIMQRWADYVEQCATANTL